MSSGLRNAFPRATYIPFNPLWLEKVEKAKQNEDIEMIIVESSIPDWEIVPANGGCRHKWTIENTIPPILEVGCQKGDIYRGQGYKHMDEWYGVDIDVWNISNFVHGDAHHLPFKDKSFKTIFFGEIAEHVEDPVQALVESIRVVSERVLVTVPNEYVWSDAVLPFMSCDDKDKMDGITRRQQIDKNSRWMPSCLNPKDYIASWDEERYSHLWHHRHYYLLEDTDEIPSGRTDRPELDFLKYIDDATKRFDEEYAPEVLSNKNFHIEKISFFPWGFLGAVIQVDGAPYMTRYEFVNHFNDQEGWFGQIMSNDQKCLVGFLRRL